MKLRLVCGNCGKIEYFEDSEIEGVKISAWEAAYQAGWDTVAVFGYTACDTCPGVSVYFPMMYAQQAREYPVGSAEYNALLEKAAAATLDFDPDSVDVNLKVQEIIEATGGKDSIKEMADAMLRKVEESDRST